MKTHRKNPTACGTSPYQGEVGRDQNNVQPHKELVSDILMFPVTKLNYELRITNYELF